MKFNVLEGAPGSREREFCLCRTVGVIKGRLGGATLGDQPQVIDRESPREPTLLRIWLPLLEPQKRSEVAWPRDSSLNHG